MVQVHVAWGVSVDLRSDLTNHILDLQNLDPNLSYNHILKQMFKTGEYSHCVPVSHTG